MATRQAIREAVIDRLYADKEFIRGTATGGGTSTVVDTKLVQGMFEANDFIGAYVWISGGTGAPDEESSKVISYDRTNGTLTVSPVFSAGVANTDTYEMHYELHPKRVNEAISYAITYGTNNALAAITADASSTTLETAVIVEGALAYCKRAIAGQTRSRDPAAPNLPVRQAVLLAEAADHEADWISGLLLIGFTPYIGALEDARQEG